jgi:hypothetical protein
VGFKQNRRVRTSAIRSPGRVPTAYIPTLIRPAEFGLQKQPIDHRGVKSGHRSRIKDQGQATPSMCPIGTTKGVTWRADPLFRGGAGNPGLVYAPSHLSPPGTLPGIRPMALPLSGFARSQDHVPTQATPLFRGQSESCDSFLNR